MSKSGSEPELPTAAKATVAVGDLLAFDDAELAEYMRLHRRPNGGFELDDLDGWTDLPDDQRDQLAQRLKCCLLRLLPCRPALARR